MNVPYYFFLPIIKLLEYFFGVLVLSPLANKPLRERGCPPEALPSPPPIGWSTGFIETPLTLGLLPNQRFLPALPRLTFMCSELETVPIVAMHDPSTNLISPEGSFMVTYLPSLASN